MNKLDYISILAEGKCKFNCPFCIGKDIRKEEKPHIAGDYVDFIQTYGMLTEEISISGSTSDPYFLSIKIHREIVKESNDLALRTSLHTRYTKDTKKLRELLEIYDEVVFGIDENALEDLIGERHIRKYKSKIRFGVVITEDNRRLINRDYLDAIYLVTGVGSFTFRPDVNSNKYTLGDFIDNMNFEITQVDKVHNSLYFYYKDKYVSYWDNKVINLNVLYLWGDGKITNNLEWKKLYVTT